MKKTILILISIILLTSCKSNDFTSKKDYNFRYHSYLLSDKKVFEEVHYDSKTQVYELKEKADISDPFFSITTVTIELDDKTKKKTYNLYESLKPIKLYNCFYNTENKELLETTFTSFYSDNNTVDSTKCYDFKKNKKIQILNTVIRDELMSTDAYRKAFKWEFITK